MVNRSTNTCHNVSKEQFENGITYIDLMEENLETLQRVLQKKEECSRKAQSFSTIDKVLSVSFCGKAGEICCFSTISQLLRLSFCGKAAEIGAFPQQAKLPAISFCGKQQKHGYFSVSAPSAVRAPSVYKLNAPPQMVLCSKDSGLSESEQMKWERENPMPPWPNQYWEDERRRVQRPYIEKMKALRKDLTLKINFESAPGL